MSQPSYVKLAIAPEMPFIKAFINLFEAFENSDRQIVDINRNLRLELYKIQYMSGTFDLYQKSDAGEAL